MPQFLTAQQTDYTIGVILLNLGLSFSLSYLAALLYRRFYTGPAYSFAFFVTLLVTPVVVAMIMMAIGSNIALSLGLVGALSVIRFRTVIKDTRDMAFLFLMIGIGLCCGSGTYLLAIMGTVFVCAVLVGVHMVGRITKPTDEFILVVRQSGGDSGETEKAMEDLVSWKKLHSAADLGDNQGFEYTYRLRLAPSVSAATLLSRLGDIESLSLPSLVCPESQLAL